MKGTTASICSGLITLLLTQILSSTSAALASKPVLEGCDVAVVGGGIGGLYPAEALQHNGYKVCVFERNDYLGGRIQDHQIPGSNSWEEPIGLGAWRFDMNHAKVRATLKKFGIEERIWNKKVSRYQPRGAILDDEETVRAEKFPTLVNETYPWRNNDTWAMLLTLNADPYGTRNTSWDMFRYTASVLGTEGRTFLEAVGNAGFRSDFYRYDPITYFEFFKHDGLEDTGEQHRPVEGMSALIRALNKSAVDAGARVFLNEPVLVIEEQPANPREGTKTFAIETASYTLMAEYVIIDAPPVPFEKIEGNVKTRIALQPQFASILADPAFKAAMVFNETWWEDADLDQFQLYITYDSCLGMVLVPYPGPNGEAVMYVSYSDGPCAYYQWSQRYHDFTPDQMAEYLHYELTTLFPDVDVPKPTHTMYQFWEEGAWHMQKPGYTYSLEDVEKWAVAPLEGKKIAMVGEAYAVRRTWSEGAITLAQKILKTHFGITDFDSPRK